MAPSWNGASSPLLVLAAGLGTSFGVAAAAWLYMLRQEEDDASPRQSSGSGGSRGADGANNTKAAERRRRRAEAKIAKAAAAAAEGLGRATAGAGAEGEALPVPSSDSGSCAASSSPLAATSPPTAAAPPAAATPPSAAAPPAAATPPAAVVKPPVAGGAPPRRDIICADALEWLRPGVISPLSIILTGIPDVCEVQNFAPTAQAWEAWFMRATKAVLEALPPRGLAVLVQTDVRDGSNGQVSKLGLVLRAAAEVEGVRLLWHKVAHFGNVDETSQGAVKYSHMICFRQGDPGPGEAEPSCGIPDVLWRGLKPRGLKNAARCFGVNMTRTVLLWASRQLGASTVVDPFCGAGTVLAVGNALGLNAVGVDISPRRVKQAGLLDGEALLAYEKDAVSAAASHRQSAPGDLAGSSVKMSARARKQAQSKFKGMSKVLLKARSSDSA